MNCINCGVEASGKFCSECGQRVVVKRITLKEEWNDFWSRLYGFDGMFSRTLRELTLRPGMVAKEYIAGNRLKYYGPVGYFFLMVTLLLLLLSMMDLNFAELIRNKQDMIAIPQTNKKLTALVTEWAADNIKWIAFLGVPFQAFTARYFFFRKSGRNFLEHTVPLFYISGHLFWITILTFVYRKIADEMPSAWIGLLSILYFGYVYSTFMTYQSRMKSFMKGIGVYLGGQLMFVIMLSLVAVAAVLILSVVDPDSLDAFRPSRNP